MTQEDLQIAITEGLQGGEPKIFDVEAFKRWVLASLAVKTKLQLIRSYLRIWVTSNTQ